MPRCCQWLCLIALITSGVLHADDARKPVRVLLLGDSTVIGSVCRVISPKADHLEDVVRKLLAAEQGLPPVEVVNKGQDGDSLHRLLAGRYEKDVVQTGPFDYIFLRYGLNDLGQLKEKFRTEYPANYKKLIAQLRKDHPQAHIVMETVIPYLGEKGDATINEQVRAVAESEKVPLLDQYAPYAAELKHGVNMLNYRRKALSAIPKKYHALVPPEYLKNGYVAAMDNVIDVHLRDVPGWFSDRHPNLAGYHVIGTQIAKYLAPKLRERTPAK